MHITEYTSLDATALALLVRKRGVTTNELLECALSAAQLVNPEINAICEWYIEAARLEAKTTGSDARFAGVPFLIKDLVLEMKGTTCRQGSTLVEDRPASEDSELMARFRRAGFITFGRTTTPAFGAHLLTASRLCGETLNPWDSGYSPGGSSGGAAAAVASGIVPIAHANDGLGSIRVPASACGLFGLKPTKQRIPTGPRYGDLLSGRGVEFVVCRSVRDAAGVLDEVHGPDPGAPYAIPPPARSYTSLLERPPKKLKIAFTRHCFSGQLADERVLAGVEEIATVCENLGHNVEECRPDMRWDAYMDALFVTVVAGTSAAVRSACESTGMVLSEKTIQPHLWSMTRRVNELSSFDLLRAQGALATSQREMGRFFENIDVFLTPVLNGSPLQAGSLETVSSLPLFWQQFAGDALSPFVGIFNVTGQPAASIPALFPEDGPPVGVQLVAKFGREDTLLSLAGQIEAAAPWANHRPAIHASNF